MKTVALLFVLLPAAGLAQPNSVFIEDLTWPEVRTAIAGGKTIALYYAGGTEQNGPHMALGKHNVIARHVAGEIARSLGNALVYPVLPFAPAGDAAAKSGHMKYEGTVTLSYTRYGGVAREVALSALAAGFRDVVLMGDHGDGQETLRDVAKELSRGRGGRVHYAGDVYYKTGEQVGNLLRQNRLPAGRHAGVEDTSELMFLDRDSRWVRKAQLGSSSLSTGVDSDPRQASAELGKVFLQVKINAGVAQIRRLTKR
jgi:creatinine amidohydrolase/Fe(II)-dependent formamide hydrolase-like protein